MARNALKRCPYETRELASVTSTNCSMHDYSRDIMLANAQTDMEANLAKMQLNKKIALTKSNEDKAGALKKQNDELGYMFLPTQVSVDILQGKPIEELTQKIERATLLDIEVHGSSEFCA